MNELTNELTEERKNEVATKLRQSYDEVVVVVVVVAAVVVIVVSIVVVMVVVELSGHFFALVPFRLPVSTWPNGNRNRISYYLSAASGLLLAR